MNYKIIDLETTVRNTIGTNKGSAHCPSNRIVLFGSKDQSCTDVEIAHCIIKKVDSLISQSGLAYDAYDTTDLLIGHNIKFDLLYLLRDKNFRTEVWPRILIWDTALVEYLLTGQDHRFPSLDECSLKYGGTIKDKRISEMWDAGVQTEDIDTDLLSDYLKGDLLNTELVFQKQFIAAQETGMLPLIWSQMLALKATTEMERNGMKVDLNSLTQQEIELNRDINVVEGSLLIDAVKMVPTFPLADMNFNSNKFIGTLLYGGELPYTTKELDGVYKSGVKKGQPKYVNKEHTVVCTPQVLTHMTSSKKVDEKTLTELRIYATIIGQEFIDLLLKYRTLNKELTTYVQGIKELVYEDGCVHGNLQHTATVTGRLSSSQPNLQNVTN